ncbi:Protein kinase domain [Musa troglodytarum]|uniref:Protein kinase domain n=1 Tax=Musa troglodytarum TaxID=320322 RepID=A0A9E7JTJ9_9LILI|nr:Protein kinase domain [Musa troglodytarum]
MDGGGNGKNKPQGFRPYESSQSSSGPSLVFGESCATAKRSLVEKLTKGIVGTYRKCNPGFKYSNALNWKRFLTNPSTGVKNDGYDNAYSDLILYVNLVLCSGSKQRYIVKDILGQGTFAQVAKCWDMETNNYVAIKIIKNQPQYYRHGVFEVHILSMLNQKLDPDDEHHIVRMLDYFLFQNHLCISFEMLGSNLYELIKENKHNGFTLDVIQDLCKQILDALIVTRYAGIIHCDLKPENILICTSEKPPKIKVIDFGSACFMSKTIYTYIQSRYYRSPEVLLGYPYTIAIDMWSLGCIVAELYLGFPLFPGESQFDVLKRMTEILGDQPPDNLLRNATKTNNFFKHVGSLNQLVDDDQSVKRNSSAYQILNEEEFEIKGLKRPKMGNKYFRYVKLENIVVEKASRKNLPDEQFYKECVMCLALIDFLRGLLEFDPAKRWSPLQASHHPFVTREPFLFHYKPLPETLLTPVSHALRVEHDPRQGHQLAAGLSPEVTNMNEYLPQNSSKVLLVPSSYESSYGSSESHGSYNYSASLGIGCRRPTSLGVSPSQFTHPSLKVQESNMFQGEYASHSPAEGSFHDFPWGKASKFDREGKHHQAYNESLGIQPHENSFKYYHGLCDDEMSSSYEDSNHQRFVSSSTFSATHHSNNRKREVSWDKPESSYLPFGPGDWDPNYSDESLVQGDCSEIDSLALGFDSVICLGCSMDLSNQTSGIGTFPLNSQQALVGSNYMYADSRNPPVIQGLHGGYAHPVSLPHSVSQSAQNTPRHFGQQSFQQFNHAHTMHTHNLWNHQKAQDIALLTNWSVLSAVNPVTALDGLSVPMHSMIIDKKLGFIHSCETGFTSFTSVVSVL